MAVIAMPRPVELIPARPQALWGWPAVLNFALGGLGAGVYVSAVAGAGFAPSPAVTLASWIGPALVLAGFAAVATEAGRPLRGPRVLTRVATSWMSRELLIGGVFVVFVAADMLFPLRLHRIQAAAVALLLVLAQGFIVRRARGVTAWDMPLIPLVFLASALVSGAGLYLLAEAASGRPPRAAVLVAVLALLASSLALWVRYLSWSPEPVFARAVECLTEGRASLLIARGGYLAPFALVALAAALPVIATPALVAAGALMIVSQFHAKARLILTAGSLRPITLAVRIPGGSA